LTFFLFHCFTLRPTVGFLKEFGGASHGASYKHERGEFLDPFKTTIIDTIVNEVQNIQGDD
jgi:hypothetical protein